MASWLGALAGGLGGAAKGFSAAAPFVMEGQQRRQEVAQNRADTQAFRDESLDIDREQLAVQRERMGYERAYQSDQAARQRRIQDMEQIRLQHQVNRDIQASRRDQDREDYGVRLDRAQKAAAQAGPHMSRDQLDRIATLQGFTDYGQVIGVLQTGGQTVAAPGAIPNPGETGLESIRRLRGTTGMSMSERYDDLLYRDEIGSALAR